MSVERMLTRKYAQAFLAVAGDDLTIELVRSLPAIAEALKAVKPAIQLLLATTKEREQAAVFEQIFAHVHLPASFNRLIFLLSEDKRLTLLPNVIQKIADLYRERAGIMVWSIKSSHELTQKMRTALQEFLARATGCVIMGEYALDADLIAGIRMRSDTLLWEYSIDKQLRTIHRLSGRGSYGN